MGGIDQMMIIVRIEQLPSTDFRPYVGQQLSDSWPTLKGHV